MDSPSNAIQSHVVLGAERRWNCFWHSFFDVLVVAGLFVLYAADPAPGTNESHYLTKARHFWDESFAHRDLFLESGDAHWVFFLSFGWLTKVCELPAAAWIGRWVGWLTLAFGWTRLAHAIFPSTRWAGSLTAPLWLAGLHWGNLSGEWVVGGFEAKVFAYAAAFVALASYLKSRWASYALALGVATAFHVLTGGWLLIATMALYFFNSARQQGAVLSLSKTASRFSWFKPPKSKAAFLGLAIAFAMIGLVPVLTLNSGADAATTQRGYLIYVYQRLPHHLSPLHFSLQRWTSYLALVAITLCLWWLEHRLRFKTGSNASIQSIKGLTIIATCLGAVGFLIDLGLSRWATNWAASLLRFYWFRWNDVFWPMLLTVLSLHIVLQLIDARRFHLRQIRALSRRLDFSLAISVLWLVIPCIVLLVQQLRKQGLAALPSADRPLVFRRVDVPRAREIRSDWLDICRWFRDNTARDALVLTPRYQQTFKWYAHRAEIACWKDAPQDAKGLIEWERRMLTIFPRDDQGYGIPMSDSHLRAMFREYTMDYVLIDRRVQPTPPLLPLRYLNDTYAVFEYPKPDSDDRLRDPSAR